ncbi:MAG: hypothetical protein ACOYOL_10740 [Chthoniobacterales bacterium]
MKTALTALILSLGVAAQGPAQSIWIQRSAPGRSAPGLVWTAGGPSWRFVSIPARAGRPFGWASPSGWGSRAVFAGRPWATTASRSTWAPAWNSSPAVVPDPVVIPTAPSQTETGLGGKP